jgi:DnaA family protein
MIKQLALDLTLDDTYTFQNFWPVANDALIHALKHYLENTLPPLMFLSGEPCSGKTHLLHACGEILKHNKQTVISLSMKDLASISPNILDGIEQLDCLLIDDIDAIADNHAWQEALFHCYNRCQDTGCHWIVSAQEAPQLLALTLKDLSSRLSHGITWALNPLSDTQKCDALVHRAKNTGLELSPSVAAYLIHHYPRDMCSQVARLEKLEQASMAACRKLTIPFIKTILETEDTTHAS